MTFISALDPALLFYRYEDWLAKKPHCEHRLSALALHQDKIEKHGLHVALSTELAAEICNAFPWEQSYGGIPELRDARVMLMEWLTTKASWIETDTREEVTLNPAELMCQYADEPRVFSAWKELLHGCLQQRVGTELDPQVATWDNPEINRCEGTITVRVHGREGETDLREYQVPLVWDDSSWASQLARTECWPDLHLCVDLYTQNNPAIRSYVDARQQPLNFEYSDAFLACLNRYCKESRLRRCLIEALTKRIYGVLDRGLHDEPLGTMRRFRVTDYWRVHYDLEGDTLMLREFGPHSIGGVD